jgi:hypothetical protein
MASYCAASCWAISTTGGVPVSESATSSAILVPVRVSPAVIASARVEAGAIFGIACSNSMKPPSVTMRSVATTTRVSSSSRQSAARQIVTAAQLAKGLLAGRDLGAGRAPVVRQCAPASSGLERFPTAYGEWGEGVHQPAETPARGGVSACLGGGGGI